MDLNAKLKELQSEAGNAQILLKDALLDYCEYLDSIQYDVDQDEYGVKDVLSAFQQYKDSLIALMKFDDEHGISHRDEV